MCTCPILRTYTCIRVPVYVWLLFSFYLRYCICVFSHHFRHHGTRSDYLRSSVSLRVCLFCGYIRLFCGHILLILWITRAHWRESTLFAPTQRPLFLLGHESLFLSFFVCLARNRFFFFICDLRRFFCVLRGILVFIEICICMQMLT